MTDADRKRTIESAMWRGDEDRLREIARCRCCCCEHTSRDCPARAWFGCLGQWTHDPVEAVLRDVARWAAFYRMTPEQFIGVTS